MFGGHGDDEGAGGVNLRASDLDRAGRCCALGLARRAVDIAPQRADAWHVLGVAQLATGDLNGAAGAIDEVPRRQPEHAEAPYNQACVASRQNRSDDAFRDLAQALRADLKLKSALVVDTDLDSLRRAPRFAALQSGQGSK